MKYILTADTHTQYHVPECRTDDFIATQIKKLKWLGELATLHKAIILNAGDVTHKAREDKQNELLNMLLDCLPPMDGVLGNHDLIFHSIDNLYKSAMSILIKSGRYNWLKNNIGYECGDDLLYGFNWGTELSEPNTKGINATIAIWHKMVLAPNDDLATFVSGVGARSTLQSFPDYDLILTGDNHKTFWVEKDGRFLVNPGSLFRLTAAQKDFKPSVFLYDSVAKTLEQIFVPIEPDVVSDAHLASKHQIDFGAYIEKLKNKEDISVNFEEQMDKRLKSETINTEIVDKIISFMEGINE